MKKNSDFKLCNETIHPGEALSFALPLPQLFSCAPIYAPIKVVHGKYDGPCLLIIAAMNANEINGTEIIYRLLKKPIMKRLHGTLLTVPVLNVYELINHVGCLRQNVTLNRSFPGKQNGSNVERFAHIFSSEIFCKTNYCVSLHTGQINYSSMPQVHCAIEDELSLYFANLFNAPIILNETTIKGSLKYMAAENNIPFLKFEAGEAMRFNEYAIHAGVEGLLNLLHKLDMLPERSSHHERTENSVILNKNNNIHAAVSGFNHTAIKLGQQIKKGDILSIIKDPFGVNESESLYSPSNGIIIGKNNLPLVREGDLLFNIAEYEEMAEPTNRVKNWYKYIDRH